MKIKITYCLSVSLDPIYIVSYYINGVKTSWIYSIHIPSIKAHCCRLELPYYDLISVIEVDLSYLS